MKDVIIHHDLYNVRAQGAQGRRKYRQYRRNNQGDLVGFCLRHDAPQKEEVEFVFIFCCQSSRLWWMTLEWVLAICSAN